MAGPPSILVPVDAHAAPSTLTALAEYADALVLEPTGHGAPVALAVDIPVIGRVGCVADVRRLRATTAGLWVARHAMRCGAVLDAVRGAGRPVVVERAFDATIAELLEAVARATPAGLPHVVCDAGIRTFSGVTLDVGAIAVLTAFAGVGVVSGLGYLRDPAHVVPMARAATAAGCSSLLVACRRVAPAGDWSALVELEDVPAIAEQARASHPACIADSYQYSF